MHFLLTNRGLRRIHGIETMFLVKEVHFLLTNGGSGSILGIERMFLVNQVHFYEQMEI